jgi:lysozyme
MALDPALIAEIKRLEGFSARPFWDQKQYTSGYGTRASGPNEGPINPETAHARLVSSLASAAQQVDTNFPGIPAGPRNALISLTYNAGPAWMTSGLGAQVRQGDFAGAKAKLLEYNRAGGEVNPGLVNRRQQEASWFDQSEIPPRPPMPIPTAPQFPSNAMAQTPQPAQQGAGGPLDLMALMGQGGGQPQSLPPLFAPPSQMPQQAAQQAPQSFFASLPAGPQQMTGADLANWWARMNPTG